MLGPFLRAARVAASLTQVELAERLGVSQGTVSGIELGRIGLGMDDFAGWASALGLTDEQRLEAVRLAGQPRDGSAGVDAGVGA